MKFEDALSLMRAGKKITHEDLEEDVYFQLCRVGLIFEDIPQDSYPLGIVKMKGDYQHVDMYYFNKLAIPFYLILSEEWKVLG